MTLNQGELWLDGETKIVAQSNGHLECSKCSTYWCAHIEQVVKEGGDAIPLLELLRSDNAWNVEWINLEVPVVPTLNIWVPVHLKATKVNNVPMWKVVWIGVDADRDDFLGFINAGEGRSVIRSMVFDFFNGSDIDPASRICESARHGYSEEVQYKEDMKNQLRRFANQWTCWYEGKCLACRGVGPADVSVASDLIPDIGPITSPWK